MVVQKFGGTSVADPDAIRRLIEIVRTARTRDGAGPAVVVSAMSGITDSLLKLATDAAAGRASEAHAGVTKIRDRHLAAAADLAPGNTQLVTSLTEQCQQLDAVVGTIATLRELTPTMEQLGSLSDQMTPVLTDLGVAAPDINTFVEELGPHHMITHTGSITGFTSSMLYFPAETLSVIVLTNTDQRGPEPLALNIARVLFGMPLQARTPRPASLASWSEAMIAA